ncbi:hypothetical protein COU00_01140 [Candidatus Falkowbacteria bacterium CG10_big_fil_rev_8_21_14_0_10_43_11]|uniref:Uncharacterized protein n=1 Tax=Candidatus Falkowbacteria bacterium CG10_big_fil_rev_8_21_14_0_10_43_11 TaxID=1974568 RepID=A0A2M6WML2_9BACT|nr:MAG: hypothetical protein COU00_01140 [Candidatus Falkowbacteria bacterium CG10_big_fil_rev_8_21_14_0_10_43_11]
MKFALKKYIYLLNDFTNLLLSKKREDEKSKVKKLLFALISVVLLLIISLFINVYLVTGA